MPSNPAEVIAFIRARCTDDLVGPGQQRHPVNPNRPACPAANCTEPVHRAETRPDRDRTRYLVQHDRTHHYPNAYPGDSVIDGHEVTEAEYRSITDGPYTPAALAIQDRVAAILAVVDALVDVTFNDLPGRDGLQIAVELLAAAWRGHPDYSTVIRGGSPAGDAPTYVDTRTTIEQEEQ